LLLVACAGGTAVWLKHAYDRPGLLAEAHNIVVPRGDVRSISERLQEAGVIADARPFRIWAWLTRGDGPLRAAEFNFPAHASLRDVFGVLRSARPVQHFVTIPEGLTAHQIGAILARADDATGSVGPIAEGSVLPDTYAYEYGTARATILARAQAAMTRALDDAWANRASGLGLSSPRQVLILASIVERETAKPEERPHIAAVYLNRLRLGMRLQADPTVAYAVSGGTGTLDRSLTRQDLARDDPFNTYRNAGLPPGPICSPGLASIQAVTHPAASDDLYFVADGSGGHAFARTMEAHDRNVARWKAIVAPSGSAGSPD